MTHGPTIAIAIAACVLLAGLIVTYPGHRTAKAQVDVDVGAVDRSAFVFTVLAVTTITFNGIRLSKGVGLFDAFLLVAALCLGIRQASGHVFPRLPRWSYLPAYLILIAGITSALVHGAPRMNVPPTVRFAIAIGLTPVVIGLTGGTRHRRQILVRAWILGACINCVVAISDFSGATHLGPSIVGGDNTSKDGRYAGLTAHPNHLAIVAAMALPIILAEAATPGRRASRRLLSAAAVGVIAVGLLASGSRAGVLAGGAALLGAALAPGAGRRMIRRIVPIAFLIATIVIVGVASKQNSLYLGFDRLIHPDSSDLSSTNARGLGFDHAMHDFLASPVFGTGFSSITNALDIFMQLLQAGGVLAFLAFFMFLRGTASTALGISRDRSRPNSDRQLAIALEVSIMAWLVFGLFQNSIYDRFLYVPASLLLAMWLEDRSEDSALERSTQEQGASQEAIPKP